MKTLIMDEFKENFTEAIDIVMQGEEVMIRCDKAPENIAVLVPFEKYAGNHKCRKLGLLESKASYSLKQGFEITDEELLSL